MLEGLNVTDVTVLSLDHVHEKNPYRFGRITLHDLIKEPLDGFE
jgi:hypothetical protein